MKKTILLASVIASMTALAVESPKGFVEGTAKGEVTFKQNVSNETKISGDVEELSVKGEVKVNRFTLGAVLANKDLKGISKETPLTTEKYTDNLLDHSSVYAKYELPEFSGIKSYVKGTLNPKAPTEDGKHNFKKGNVELEGQLAHSFSNGVEVSLTSKTKFPFEKKDGEYGKGVESEHVVKLGAKKLNKFEDLEASLKLNHTYAKEEAFKFVDLSGKGTYAGLKDTKLTGKVNFRYQVNGTSDVKDLLTDGQIKLNKDAYAHSYELDGKYTGVKDLELTAGAFVQHVHYANAGYENYASNELESLYASSLISNDKDFFKHHAEKLEAAKKDFEKTEKELNTLEANDDKMKEYNLAVANYNKAFELKKEAIKKEFETAKKNYDSLTSTQKEVAQKDYTNMKNIFDYTLEYKDLSEKKTELLKYYNTFTDEFKNSSFKDAEIQKIDTKLNDLKDKLIAARTQLNGPANDASNTGLAYAQAEFYNNKYDKKMFDVDKSVKFVKDDKGNVTKIDVASSDTNKSAKDLADALNSNPVKLAKEKVENYKKGLLADSYDKAKKSTAGLVSKLDLVNFGFKLGAKYTGVKNLTLTADGVFGGRHHSAYDQLLKFPAYTTGYVKLHAGAKYDFKLLNDKLVVSPEGNVTAKFTDIYAGICNPSLVLAPKVSVEYKPVDALKVAGSVEVPVNFGLNTLGDFGYQSTSIKGALNMKYEWK